MNTLQIRFVTLRFFLGILPRNAVSLATGWLARLQLPAPLQRLANSLFVHIFRLNMGEAQMADPGSYASIEDLFIRHLRPGLRPARSRYVSPADGYLAWSAPLRHGAAIQAKGIDYDPAELVWGSDSVLHATQSANFKWFTTVYLAPHNYHRVHAPVSGLIQTVRHIPGDLWPVNEPFVRFFPDLFLRNERLVFDIALTPDIEGRKPHPEEEGMMAHVVMVGAFNVGRMTTHLLPGFSTNSAIVWPQVQRSWSLNGNPEAGHLAAGGMMKVNAGDELGAFLLGSTVVIVLNDVATKFLKPVQAAGNRPILMGQSLMEEV